MCYTNVSIQTQGINIKNISESIFHTCTKQRSEWEVIFSLERKRIGQQRKRVKTRFCFTANDIIIDVRTWKGCFWIDLKSANSNKQKNPFSASSTKVILKTFYITEDALSVAPFETSWHLKISLFTRPGQNTFYEPVHSQNWIFFPTKFLSEGGG